MLTCNWCSGLIDSGEPVLTLALEQADAGGASSGFAGRVMGDLHLHEDCGSAAVLGWLYEQFNHDTGLRERPSPDCVEVLDRIPVMRSWTGRVAEADGPVTEALLIVRHLGERKATYALYEHGIETLIDVSRRSRAEIAALPGIGPKALDDLDRAMRERGLCFIEAPTAGRVA